MMKLLRTDSDNTDFRNLVTELDKDLSIRNGESNEFYVQFNKIVGIKYAVVTYQDGLAVGCGAIKHYAVDTMEVKRMFVRPDYRGKGIAGVVLRELEDWTKELGYLRCILETDKMQPEAIALYRKNGYNIIPNYDQYAEDDKSVCFEKKL